MSLPKNSRGVTLLKWAGTLISVVLLILLLSQQDWQAVTSALSQVPLWRFVLAFLLMLISRIAVAFRWHVLLRVISDKVSWVQSIRLTFAGLFATNFLPTTIGGDIVRLAGAVKSDLDAAMTTASLVIDRLVGMFGMVLMLPFGIVPLYGWFSTNQSFQELSSISKYMMGSVVMLKNIWHKTTCFMRRIIHSNRAWLDQPVSLIQSLVFTGIHMLCFFYIFWELLRGMSDAVDFWKIAGLYSFVYLVTLLPVSINGYGLQELSISMIFSEVGGVSLQNSLTIALIFRTLTMLASLPGVMFLPDIISSRNSGDGKEHNDPDHKQVADS